MRHLSKFPQFSFTALYLFISLALLIMLTQHLLPDGYFISGHDSGLALDSKSFLETRLFAWDERINFGEDNSLLFGSLTLHAIDYFSSLIAGVPYSGNQINLFFWLALIFIAAFTFSSQLRQSLGNPFVYIFPFFITFNFYIFQSIFILERAKYSLVAATLFFLAVLIRFFDKKISIIPAAIIVSLVFSIFNGGSWLGLPLYGGLLIIIIITLVFVITNDLRNKAFKTSLSFILFLLTSAILFLLVNSYSLYPYLQTFFAKDYLVFQNAATQDSNKAWVDYISQGSSFINIFRMQGVPDWYETKFIAAPMHPFAKFYLENPLMLILSFFIPIGAFASLLFVKNSVQKRIVAISSTVLLVSMILMAASRSPWGFVYEFLYNNVPGFLIFRSSFYKFGYAFVISCSVLLAFTLSSILNLIDNKLFPFKNNTIVVLLTILVIVSWITYHQKLISSDIFKWREDFSTQVEIPEYVNEYKNYVKEKNISEGRVLLLPKFHKIWLSDGYDWGYWSLSTIHYSLTKEPVISNSSGLNQQERYWVNLLYQSISEGDAKKTEAIAARLGVTRILLKMDAIQPSYWSAAENPQDIKKIVDSFNFIQQEKHFGKWILYKINSPQPKLFSAQNKLVQLNDTDVSKVYPFIENELGILKNSDQPDLSLFTTSGIDQHKCISCVVEEPLTLKQLIWSRLLPNSILFPVKMAYENYKLQKISDQKLKLQYYFDLILKRSAEVSAMFFYRTHDAYIIGNLKTIRSHLDQVSMLIKETSSSENFSDAKNLLNNIENTKSLLVNQIQSEEAALMSGVLKEEVYKTIWKIEEVKKYYASILENRERWSQEKVFELEIEELPYQLYLDQKSLPLVAGSRVLPEIVINDQPTSNSLDQSSSSENWISLNSSSLKVGKNKIILKFPPPSNILKIESPVLVNTPEGKRNCYRARPNSPPQSDTYLLKVKTDSDTLKVFTRLSKEDDFSSYLNWDKSITIGAHYSNQYSESIYPVPSLDEDFTFYICGQYEYLPKFKEFIVQELFAPEMIGIKRSDINPKNTTPKVLYTRINATKFSVHIEGATSPYILVMNQSFSPLWEVKSQATGQNVGSTAFKVDLYATGWVMDSSQKDLIIEYSPQQFFYRGAILSGITLSGILIGIVLIALRKKTK